MNRQVVITTRSPPRSLYNIPDSLAGFTDLGLARVAQIASDAEDHHPRPV